MKSLTHHSYPSRLLTLVGTLFISSLAFAQGVEQILSLDEGWNAVWLEVDPAEAPGDVFTDPSILAVVSPKPLAGLAEFFADDPGTISTFNQEEWEQWKRTDLSGSNNLTMISGNRPYLVQTDAPVTMTVSGAVRFYRPNWTADRYNLLGFGLEGQPSFDDFFGPSGAAHPVSQIFRLEAVSGAWQPVLGTETMTSGEAYWVFSAGPSEYMGPISVDFDYATTGSLNFGGPTNAVTVGTGIDTLQLDLEEIVFSNIGSATASPSLELVGAAPGSGSLDLHVVIPDPDSFAFNRGNQVDSDESVLLPPADLGEPISSQSTAFLTLGASRNWVSGAVTRTNIYRLKTGPIGAAFWLPVTALNNDLQLPSDLLPETVAGLTVGLWVGEANITKVTSFVEDGAPSRPAAGSAPVRILLHSDVDGVVSLLSQVTIMQTRTADPEVDPIPVLVVDPAKIPYFEGVKERNGKQVGLRLEAVAYDMPRRLDGINQANLIEDPKFLQLTNLSTDLKKALGTDPVLRTTQENDLIAASTAEVDAAKLTIPNLLPNYLLSSAQRPPKLAEVYHFSWQMEGSIGSGKTVRTLSTNPLVLDPFHRSNPFRHAFHLSHISGQNITRSMTLVFDPDQSISGRLTGTFTETIQGLTKSNLSLTGSMEFRRVSSVNILEGAE